jgi:hypothetical protein
MADETYEAPQITVLGEVTDLTQKGGIYFDYGHATEGSPTPPAPGSPGSFPS